MWLYTESIWNSYSKCSTNVVIIIQNIIIFWKSFGNWLGDKGLEVMRGRQVRPSLPVCKGAWESCHGDSGTWGRVNSLLHLLCLQAVCKNCYRGNLVSIHNSNINRFVYRMVSKSNQAQVWTGGYTKCWVSWKPVLKYMEFFLRDLFSRLK